jgi:hypothetical protein
MKISNKEPIYEKKEPISVPKGTKKTRKENKPKVNRKK